MMKGMFFYVFEAHIVGFGTFLRHMLVMFGI
jgi:hypothetical protein